MTIRAIATQRHPCSSVKSLARFLRLNLPPRSAIRGLQFAILGKFVFPRLPQSPAPQEWMQHLAEIAVRNRLPEAETLRFVVRAAVGAEQDIHQRRDVRVVAGVAVA